MPYQHPSLSTNVSRPSSPLVGWPGRRRSHKVCQELLIAQQAAGEACLQLLQLLTQPCSHCWLLHQLHNLEVEEQKPCGELLLLACNCDACFRQPRALVPSLEYQGSTSNVQNLRRCNSRSLVCLTDSSFDSLQGLPSSNQSENGAVNRVQPMAYLKAPLQRSHA